MLELRRRLAVFALCFAPLCPTAFALDISDEDLIKQGWSAEIEGGISYSTGNTDESAMRFRGEFDYFWADWRHFLKAEANSSKSNGQNSAERYRGSYKADRDWTDVDYTFGLVTYENDRFNGLEDLFSLVAGWGHRFFPGEGMELYTEAGPGYRWNNSPGSQDSEAILRGASQFDWTISENSTFRQIVTFESGESNVISRSETSLTTSIIGSLALKVSISMTHQSQPEENDDGSNKDKLDTISGVTLLYRY
ncbi:DUF481 domain-containing protein [Neiella marina]|uniref:DUF481 domain-containing protein n=1 Tax=Neiella holothuriorum TaxID=2870530 RepID=A0ABS7EKB3_9GAMM|nr:DUF481 domain-containing protein [Neiella holothuriorum]MBW8192674.1 DUF481 domain-containing protein [Neiella holothuriorum]